MDKPRVLILGGLPHNVPNQLRRACEIVRHVTVTDMKKWDASVSFDGKVDLCLILVKYAPSHKIKNVERILEVPCFRVNTGWGQMREELIRHGFLVNHEDPSAPKLKIPTVPIPPKEASPPPLPTVTGLPPEELWRLYGQNVIATMRAVIKPGERLSEKEMTETVALLVGIPTQDIHTILPELAMRGLLQPDGDGFWIRTPDMGNDEEMEKAQQRERGRTRKIPITGTTAIEAKLVRGLPMGPYSSKNSIVEKMRQYAEFLTMSFRTCQRRVESALVMGIIEENHGRLYIDHDPSIRLTLAGEGVTRGL